MVEIEHTGPEFCLNCYNKRYVEIKMKWDRKEAAFTKWARKQEYTPAQVESLRARVRQEMKNEIIRLEQEWEEMWRTLR